ncbi:MAG: hypothetical protein HYV03_05440, partial [Deltaproteobacteria bacterium]|nr:hypothetical protein [Deltaproteobacteria bacterium]
MATKVASLEQALERTERLTNRLEQASGMPAKGLTRGIGPVMEENALPTVPSLSSLKQFALDGVQKREGQFAFDNLDRHLEQLRKSADQVEERLQKVYEVRQQKTSFWAAMPTLWPVRGFITSGFGYRRGVGTRFHEGIDIASPIGTP